MSFRFTSLTLIGMGFVSMRTVLPGHRPVVLAGHEELDKQVSLQGTGCQSMSLDAQRYLAKRLASEEELPVFAAVYRNSESEEAQALIAGGLAGVRWDLLSDTASVVIPFDTSAYDAKIDPNDSILSIAERLAKYGGGGTDCSLPLVAANQKHAKRKFAGVVLVSDTDMLGV